MSHGEITLAGVTLTLDEWEALDEEAQQLLLSFAAEGAAEEGAGAPDDVRYSEQNVHLPAIIDLLQAWH